ncbi:VOC family protein [uncultured Roseobacter sp.]|uniref:VOC family protein n=1 Tax=uncultured Roseobacter sp. TaxID=114847 RepID=UPI00262ECEB7|nr:VOC family protein [uncultured Roseobacter sp.]
MLVLDHLAVAGDTLTAARDHVEAALGVSMQPGGEHAVFHTHNALLGLEDGLYLEAIAINPTAPAPDRARWFDLDRFEGGPRLTNWICRTADLETALAALGPEMGAPVALRRGDLRWRMAVPQSGVLPYDNCAPALITWDTQQHPALMLAHSGIRLRRLTIRHPQAARICDRLAPHLADDRLSYEQGAAGLHAVFDTPQGPRELGK